MLLSEERVRFIAEKFMPRLKSESLEAMVDVVSNGMSVLAAADRRGITHQSLSKNLLKFKQLEDNIASAAYKLSGSYLLSKNAEALYHSEVEFEESKLVLTEFCKALGGTVEESVSEDGINLHLDGQVLEVYLNPSDSFEYKWAFDMNEEA